MNLEGLSNTICLPFSWSAPSSSPGASLVVGLGGWLLHSHSDEVTKPFGSLLVTVLMDRYHTGHFSDCIILDHVSWLYLQLTIGILLTCSDLSHQVFWQSPGLALIGQGWQEDDVNQLDFCVHMDVWVSQKWQEFEINAVCLLLLCQILCSVCHPG